MRSIVLTFIISEQIALCDLTSSFPSLQKNHSHSDYLDLGLGLLHRLVFDFAFKMQSTQSSTRTTASLAIDISEAFGSYLVGFYQRILRRSICKKLSYILGGAPPHFRASSFADIGDPVYERLQASASALSAAIMAKSVNLRTFA